jgi:hypothetical protein
MNKDAVWAFGAREKEPILGNGPAGRVKSVKSSFVGDLTAHFTLFTQPARLLALLLWHGLPTVPCK